MGYMVGSESNVDDNCMQGFILFFGGFAYNQLCKSKYIYYIILHTM